MSEINVIHRVIRVTHKVVNNRNVFNVSSKQGLPGPAGQGVFTHSQASPAAVWTINHNLGRYVSTSVYSVGGVEMWAEVVQINTNQVQVIFDTALAGIAICS